MSSSIQGQTYIPSSNFKSILDATLSQALGGYKKKTGKKLLDHPLATELQRCDSVDAVLEILQGQASAFQQFRDGDQRLMKWISPVVDVLYAFSGTLGGVAGLAFPPAGVIFTGIGILLSAAKDVRSSHDALVELFERIESFFRRLGVYTRVSLTTEMARVLVKIVTEVLCILSIATKEVKRKRARIYFRKLLGRTDIEDALRRLEGLIQEEVRMAIAQTMNDAKEANDNINEIKWNQIEQDVRRWFSPPDPSINHNIACEVYHNVPPTWFFRAGLFKDWMSDGSLLWIHGKPGSGKSILCSAIIQHIMTLRDAGRATLAYFYFDFRDEEKQNVRNFVTSLLVQLSAYSKPCCDIIYRLYLAHGNGAQQPSNSTLMDRLKEMLTIASQNPIFIIMDALDECPDSGMPTPREAVLNLVKGLVRLHLPNLHICVTSRPEIDIQTKLKPLAVNAISLHDESRQKIVIANYVSSVVSSDEQMRRWRDEDKKLVVEELSERADGMFQWVFCQLETLRHAVQPDVREILEKLPKTLDETYERVLKNINKHNRKYACRLLHCLAVSVRPLRVEELAEILTFDFDTAEGDIPKFRPDRRPKDQEGAILSTCSSLIVIVDNRGSRVVQFSHLSVKEFLISKYLASSTGDLSLYRILPGRAHTILAQVCLGFLLHLDNSNDDKRVKSSPLAEYAARHWVAHAQFEDVASHVEDGMKSLFDLGKLHFAAWLRLYDMDAVPGKRLPSEIPSPLYYSALCGFHDLVLHIAIKHPQLVNAIGGSYAFPLVAALCKNHFPVAELLLKHGGSVDIRDTRKQTALHKTIVRHDKVAIDAVKFLLEHGAEVNARRDDLWTPLHLAVNIGELSVVRMLLERQADANSRNGDGQTPLHLLSKRETSRDEDDDGSGIAKVLLERSANVNERDKDNATPLHLASYNKKLEIVRVLLDHGANANAENHQGKTPLWLVLRGNHNTQEDGVEIVRLLLERGAEAYGRDKYHISASDLAYCFGKERIGKVLLDNGENFQPENNQDQTAFRRWIEESGVDRNLQNKYDTILLHSASYHGRLEMARILLNHGAKSNVKNHQGETTLHVVSRSKYDSQDSIRVAQLLLDHGADVNAQLKNYCTPLHVASYFGKLEIARVLLNQGAWPNAKDDRGRTPLHQVLQGEFGSQADRVDIARLLLDRGVDANAQDKSGVTALHLASWYGRLEIARVLLGQATMKNDRVRSSLSQVRSEERNVDLNVQQKEHETLLHFASFQGKLEIVRLLLDHGANASARNNHGEIPLHKVSCGNYESQEDGARIAQLLLEGGRRGVNAQRKDRWTPLHLASYFGKLEIVRLLLDHGAKATARNNVGETPLHKVSRGNYEPQQDGALIAQLLLEGGKEDVNVRRKDHWTPLHLASYFGKPDIARVLLNHGAEANAKTSLGGTPLHTVTSGNHESKEDGVLVAQLLLECGVDVNARRNDNWTPLHLASYFGKFEIARMLLDHGAEAITETDSRETPLHVLCGKYESREDGVRVAQLLLDRGVDVNARRKDHQTPLHVASYFGKFEIAQVLIDHGANVNAKTDSGETPLHKVSCGKYESREDGICTLQLLLECGVDVNAPRKDYWTPMHLASYFGKPEIARILLENGAEADKKTDTGETPLHVSCGNYESREDGVRVAQLLLDRGVDVNPRRDDYWTPLHVASYNGKSAIARLLLARGAAANAKADAGDTPLHIVAYGVYESPEDGVRVAQRLLECGADVNARRKDHWTPLHVSSYFGKLEVARILLDHGANVTARTDSGETPLHVSCRQCESNEDRDGTRVPQLLLQHGAEANKESKDHWTPLHVASYSGKLEIVRVLLNHGAKADAVDDVGLTPLHNVPRGTYFPDEAGVGVARLLLEHGANVNAKDMFGTTTLDFASHMNKPKLAQLLENATIVNAERPRTSSSQVGRLVRSL